ncbi:MAG TPA: DUF1318 domain-containing protein [Polyangiaceae bacterium]|nr:DUF1318 domain-containing protein [Polyangiaceae bacterium]
MLAAAAGGCVNPEFVIVDRATALEQQASGSFDDVEQRLDRAAVEPRPVPLTPAQLEALGIGSAPKADGAEVTDADRVDALLVQHCIGEGHEGLLVDTRDQCHGAADSEEVLRTVEAVNRARRQLWRWMHDQKTSASVDELRKAWREAHLRAAVCGAWVEGDDGKWQGKAC